MKKINFIEKLKKFKLDPAQLALFVFIMILLSRLAMKTISEAGNEYQNLKLTGVGITVYAVQGNVGVYDTTATQTESENMTEADTQTDSENATEADTQTESESATEAVTE